MKKVLRVLSKILRPLLLLFTAVMVLFTVATAFGLNRETGLFGMRMFIVLTDSMSDRFRAGDLTVAMAVDPETLEIGDIISFRSIDPINYGAVVTHMIKAKTIHNDRPAFITYGTANNTEDAVPVPLNNVLGKYAFHIPKAGYIFDSLKTPMGYLLMILLPFLLIIAFEGANFLRLLKQYRFELKEEATAGSVELEQEKKKSEAMSQELERLRRALDEREHGQEQPIPAPPAGYFEPARQPDAGTNEQTIPAPDAEADEQPIPAPDAEADEQPIPVPAATAGDEKNEEPAIVADDLRS